MRSKPARLFSKRQALLAFLAISTVAQADPFGHLQWRSVGPFRGGRVLAVAGAPGDRQRFYFGAVNGGVWRTDDAGRTWQPIFDGAPVGSIGALAVAPGDPRVLYVGTGEADMRSDIAQGVGMFRSDDAGAHWRRIGLEDTQQIGRIWVDPRDAKVLLVAALGHPYGPNAQRGIFRSEDGGAHWTQVLFHDADTGAIDLAAAPDDPDVIYAAMWQTRRPPWNVYPPSSGPGSGLYKSTDGGRSWKPVAGHGFPAAPGRIGLATTPAAPGRVYALVSVRDGDAAGLYRSDDHGETWRRVSADKRITERGWYFSGVTADPKDADSVYVCDTILLRSRDGGAHFEAIKGDITGDDFHALWIDPADPQRRILGVDQGALVSVNGGRSWSSWFNQPTGQFYHVSTDNRFPYRIYGAQQDSGAAAVSSRAENPFDGIGMQEFHESAAGGESDNIAPDPDDPDTVFGGRVDRLDLRSGQMRSVDPTLAFPDAYRATWTLPLIFGPLDHALYFANQRIFRTRDGGARWQTVSPDLTRPAPAVPPTLDAPTREDVTGLGARRGVVYAIAPSPKAAGLIWAGTDDGLVWRSGDGGAHWVDVTPAGLTDWSKIGTIEASHFDAGTAYLAVDRHRLEDAAPHFFRTHDGGAHWTEIDGGLPSGPGPNSANVIREDTQRRGLLFAGTERGAYVSLDDGDHWQALQNNLPRTSVRDMVLHGDDLVMATHGRGFYVLDDMASLRVLADGAPAGPMLFAPSAAVRLHPVAFAGTPMPKDEPMAENPPVGAIFDYALPQGAQNVTLDILDAAGRPIRHFSSADKPKTPDAGALPMAPEWVEPPAVLATSAGNHRFVWDLRLGLPPILEGGDAPVPAILAPPANYTAVLTVDGVAFRQSLQIRADPRVQVTAAAFQAEFEFARLVQAARVQCRQALADAVKKGRADRVGAPGAGGQGQPAPVDGLTAIADRLDKLAIAADGGDGAPTPDARAGFASAQEDLRKAAAF